MGRVVKNAPLLHHICNILRARKTILRTENEKKPERLLMNVSQRQTLFTMLLIATALVILNIFIITTGTADSYYAGIKEWIDTTLLLSTS